MYAQTILQYAVVTAAVAGSLAYMVWRIRQWANKPSCHCECCDGCMQKCHKQGNAGCPSLKKQKT